MLQYYLVSLLLAAWPVTDDAPLGRRHRLEVPRAGRRKRRCLAFAPLAGAGAADTTSWARVWEGASAGLEKELATRGRLGRSHAALRLLFYCYRC